LLKLFTPCRGCCRHRECPPLRRFGSPQCIHLLAFLFKRLVGTDCGGYTATSKPPARAVVEGRVWQGFVATLKEQPSSAEATGLLMPVD